MNITDGKTNFTPLEQPGANTANKKLDTIKIERTPFDVLHSPYTAMIAKRRTRDDPVSQGKGMDRSVDMLSMLEWKLKSLV